MSWLFQWVTSGSGERERINNITYKGEREREGEIKREHRVEREKGIEMKEKGNKEIRNEIGKGFPAKGGKYKVKKKEGMVENISSK